MLIIGITGTLGAGKGTVVEYLVGNKGFDHFSVRALILEFIRERGMPENRDSMVVVANGLRAKHGSSFLTDQLYLRAAESGHNCVIESIRTPGEILSLRKKGLFWLFAVDAAPETRYRRIRLRRSETDNISYETFLSDEQREMNTTDPGMQNLAACIRMADFVFTNNGSKEDLFREVEKVLRQITSQE